MGIRRQRRFFALVALELRYQARRGPKAQVCVAPATCRYLILVVPGSRLGLVSFAAVWACSV